MKKTYTEPTFVIIPQPDGSYHYSSVPPGTTLHTAQDNVEEFTDEAVWAERVTQLGGVIPSLKPESPQVKVRKTADQRQGSKKNAAPTPPPVKTRLPKGLNAEQRKAARLQKEPPVPGVIRPQMVIPQKVEAKPTKRSKKKSV